MRNILLVACLLLSLQAISARVCKRNRSETPCYETIRTAEGYEERKYESSVWVSAQFQNLSAAAQVNWPYRPIHEVYMKLHDYFRGQNSLDENITRTTPVRVLLDEDNDLLTMSFFLPKRLHDNPPDPLDGNVTITREPERKYIVRSFTGESRGRQDWAEQRGAFIEALEDRTDYNRKKLYEVVYDNPIRTPADKRYHELWYQILKRR